MFKYVQNVQKTVQNVFKFTVCGAKASHHRLRGISGFHRKTPAACRNFSVKSRKKSDAFAPGKKYVQNV